MLLYLESLGYFVNTFLDTLQEFEFRVRREL